MLHLLFELKILKQTNKQFSEIIFEDEKIKFFFFNQMKSPLILSKTEVRIDLSNDEIEFTNLITNKYIGNAYKNRIAEPEKWDDLIESINHLK